MLVNCRQSCCKIEGLWVDNHHIKIWQSASSEVPSPCWVPFYFQRSLTEFFYCQEWPVDFHISFMLEDFKEWNQTRQNISFLQHLNLIKSFCLYWRPHNWNTDFQKLVCLRFFACLTGTEFLFLLGLKFTKIMSECCLGMGESNGSSPSYSQICEAGPFSLHHCAISHTKRSKISQNKSTCLYLQY